MSACLVTVNQGTDLEDGDTLLLCSDGFWEPLNDALIGASLAKTDIEDTFNYYKDEMDE